MITKSLTYLLRKCKYANTTKCSPLSTLSHLSHFPLDLHCCMLVCSSIFHQSTIYKSLKSTKNSWIKKYWLGWIWSLLIKTTAKFHTVSLWRKSYLHCAFGTMIRGNYQLRFSICFNLINSLSSTLSPSKSNTGTIAQNLSIQFSNRSR